MVGMKEGFVCVRVFPKIAVGLYEILMSLNCTRFLSSSGNWEVCNLQPLSSVLISNLTKLLLARDT